MTPHERAYRETCGWPGCIKAVSWRQAWCYPHWKRIPEQERREAAAAVFAARAARDAAAKDQTNVSAGENEEANGGGAPD